MIAIQKNSEAFGTVSRINGGTPVAIGIWKPSSTPALTATRRSPLPVKG